MRIVYDFKSTSTPELHGFTDDRSGAKLPAEYGPWTFDKEVSVDGDWHYQASRAVVIAGIRENGFSLWDKRGSTRTPSTKPIIESDRVEGTAVFGPDDRQIGTIKRLLIEKVSGRVLYVDMVFGGFLGLGAHHHTIPWEKLTYDTRLGGYHTDITAEQVKGAPAFYGGDGIWPDRKRGPRLQDHRAFPYHP